MKNIFAVCFALIAINVNAQTNFTYHLTVKDNQSKPKGGLPVNFIETSTFEKLSFTTNAQGELDVVFDHGDEWMGSVGEMYNSLLIKSRGNGRGSDFVTYDLVKFERENRILPNRNSITFKQTPQNFTTMVKPTATQSTVKIVLESSDGSKVSGTPVTITCFKLEEQFRGKTNANGECIFQLPISQDYEIDVADIPSLNWIDLDATPMAQTVFLRYDKKQFTEKEDNGYIVQTIPGAIKPSSSHAKVTLRIRKDGNLLPNEPVYLRTVKSKLMYKAITNANGEVVFMLPLKNRYMIDFTFQMDAGVIDLSRAKGIATQEQTINYHPDPRLQNIESFIPRVEDLVDLDIESFINSQYPSSDNEVDLFLKWGNKFNASSKEAVLEVGFKVNSANKKPLMPKNLVFVIDVSGSMSNDDRLELLKQNLIEYVGKLSAKDYMSIVVFSDNATLAVPTMSATNKAAIIEIIRALHPTGGTNIFNGVDLGFQELAKNKKTTHVNRLILMTDGYGGEEPQLTIDKAKEYIAKGFQITTVGVGYDYNAALLSQLASMGGGSLQMAGDPSQFQKIFQSDLGELTNPVGKDVTLEVLYNNNIVYRQLMGYAGEKVSSGKMTVSFDQLFPGLEKMALMKFDVINSTPAIENDVVTARLKYTDPASGKQKTVEKILSPEWTTATGLLDMTLDMNQKKIMCVAITNQSMKNMADAFAAGDRTKARAAADNGIKQIQKLFPDAAPGDIQGLMDKLQQYVTVFDKVKSMQTH